MISVCMATYNGERFIRRQVDSILCQLKGDDEIIVSDDGSTDRTLEILESYNDSRIKIFHHERDERLLKEKNGRNFYLASSNFENAIIHANGDFIFLSDQDDEWKTGKVEKMSELLKNYDCVQCGCEVIDEEGRGITSGMRRIREPSRFLLYNMFYLPFMGCRMAIKRSALQYIIPFPKKCISHDLWMGCLCTKRKSFAYIPEPLHKYRRHSNNVSPSLSKKKSNTLFFMMQYRLSFLYLLHKRIVRKRLLIL